MSTVTNPNTAERRVVLREVSWSTYQALARESRGGRLAYDRGTLEIMSPSYNHESVKGLVGRLIEVYAEELAIEICTSGSTTLLLEELERGIESDESYYIASLSEIKGKAKIDLAADPPPDLVIEVDITRSSVNKLDIYRSLGIPEVWRYTNNRLDVYVLGDDQQYQQCEASTVLPGFPLHHATELLAQRDSIGETQMARTFRALVKESR